MGAKTIFNDLEFIEKDFELFLSFAAFSFENY
jgi:hypothetical protein